MTLWKDESSAVKRQHPILFLCSDQGLSSLLRLLGASDPWFATAILHKMKRYLMVFVCICNVEIQVVALWMKLSHFAKQYVNYICVS